MPKMPVCYQGMVLAYRENLYIFTLTGVNMNVCSVFLLNKKHCIGCTIHVWCLIPVTYVSGKCHWCRYVCMVYKIQCNRKQKSCVCINPPPNGEGMRACIQCASWLLGC
jgi:hypothetical protein